MEIQKNLPIGYKCAFMPDDEEIMDIGYDVITNPESFYKDMVVEIDMYDISFTDRLANTFPAIEVENKFLVITDRRATPDGKGFVRDLIGSEDAYRQEEASFKVGKKVFVRELVLVHQGNQGDPWCMKEFSPSPSDVIETKQVICSVFLRDASTKAICAGLVAVNRFRMAASAHRKEGRKPNDLVVVVSDDEVVSSPGRKKEDDHHHVYDDDDDDDYVLAMGKVNLDTRRGTKGDIRRKLRFKPKSQAASGTRGDIRRPRVKSKSQGSGTKTQVSFQGVVEGETTPRRVELNFSQERDMSTGEYYNQDEPDYNQRKMAKQQREREEKMAKQRERKEKMAKQRERKKKMAKQRERKTRDDDTGAVK